MKPDTAMKELRTSNKLGMDNQARQIQTLLKQAEQAYAEFEKEMAALQKKQQQLVAGALKKRDEKKIEKIKKQISNI